MREDEDDDMHVEYWQGRVEELERRIIDLQEQINWLRAELSKAHGPKPPVMR